MRYTLKHKRSGDSDANTIMLAVLVITLLTVSAGLIGVGPLAPYIKASITGGGTGGGTGGNAGGCAPGYSPPTGFLCANLQAQYFVFDPLVAAGTGNGINAAQVSVINPQSLASVDVPATTASTGLVTGGYYFITGQSYYCKIVTTNYVTEIIPCFIPPISNSAQQVTVINLPLPEIKTNTWSWSASGAGTTWSSTFAEYSYANTGLTTISMTFTITANNNNQGYLSGYDLVNKVQDLAVWEFSSPSSPTTTVTGCQYAYKLNNVQYCQFLLPDGFTTINPSYSLGSSAISSSFPTTPDGRYATTQPKSQTIMVGGVSVTGALSQQLAGTTLVAGTLSFPLTINLGSLAAGSSETWTMKCWLYSDVLNFDGGGGYQASGTYGPSGTTPTPTQATLTGGNSPTFKLRN